MILMLLLTKPTEERIREFISSQQDHPFSYPGAGSSSPSPRGYNSDHNRIRLGEGNDVFYRAVKAVKRWQMFNMGWLQLCWPDAQIEVGVTVAVLARSFGFWSLNACRIASVMDEDADVRRYGFVYGTLPDHTLRGQESFTVEWRRDDDAVHYDIMAYSKPNQLVAWLVYPLTRLLQRRFAEDSITAMLRAVND